MIGSSYSQVLAVSMAMAAGVIGCSASTQGRFVLPRNAQLEVNNERVDVQEDGSATMPAFGWGGARYKVVRDGKTVSSGKLDTKFRPISLIWPPFGVLYVPKGLDEDRTYDLTTDESKAAKPHNAAKRAATN